MRDGIHSFAPTGRMADTSRPMPCLAQFSRISAGAAEWRHCPQHHVVRHSAQLPSDSAKTPCFDAEGGADRCAGPALSPAESHCIRCGDGPSSRRVAVGRTSFSPSPGGLGPPLPTYDSLPHSEASARYTPSKALSAAVGFFGCSLGLLDPFKDPPLKKPLTPN